MASTVSKAGLLLGRCVPCVKKNATKILVSQMDYDKNLIWYFKKYVEYYAHDPDKTCKVGDVVLIRELPQKMTTLITHKVERVMYKLGDVIDPITNKPVVVSQYRDEMDENVDLYGRLPSAFDYKKAPPRGRLEGIRDFTDKGTYTKYHDDGTNDPYAV